MRADACEDARRNPTAEHKADRRKAQGDPTIVRTIVRLVVLCLLGRVAAKAHALLATATLLSEPCDELIMKKLNAHFTDPCEYKSRKEKLGEYGISDTNDDHADVTTIFNRHKKQRRTRANLLRSRRVSSQRLTRLSACLHLEMRTLLRLRDGVAACGEMDQSQLHMRVQLA